MDVWARLPALVAGFVGVAALSSLPTPFLQTISPGDPDVVLVVASVLTLAVTARLAISSPTARTAWGRTLAFNGLWVAVIALAMSKEPSVTGRIGALIFVGVGVVVFVSGLILLAGANRGSAPPQSAAKNDDTTFSDFAPEGTLVYRREAGTNYRAFVRHIWANAEISFAPLAASVDDRPCRIVSVAPRPGGGCYINVILEGVGYALMAHAHRWSTQSGPIDIATWGLHLLATENTSSDHRAVSDAAPLARH
jgi:hypothetical protein